MDDRSRSHATETQPEGNFIDAPAAAATVGRGKRRAVPLLILGIVLAAAAGWFISQHRQQSRPVASNQPLPVATAVAASGDIDITLDALGTVTSLATVTVVSQISGQLVSVNYIEGQKVKKGDLLAEIDERPYQLLLAQAQGALERDQALLQNAELDLKRYQDLAKSNSIPRQQLDTQVSLVIQYQGNVVSDQAQIDTAETQYFLLPHRLAGQRPCRASPGGSGQLRDAGPTTGLAVITQLQPITVIFPVAEDYLPQIIRAPERPAPTCR